MAKKTPAAEAKNNVVLDRLDVTYLPVDAVKPNQYNPNRQSDHDFELLCKSIAEDGFTQPIVVDEASMEIVDGEHRWRACKALGFPEVPVVLTRMTAEQRRISTLRHNRARGAEDASMAADVLREIEAAGEMAWAQDSLMLDDLEVKRLLEDVSPSETDKVDVGPSSGPTATVLDGQTDPASEKRRKETAVAQAKAAEQQTMERRDGEGVYRVLLVFEGEEAACIQRVIRSAEKPAHKVVELCQKALARKAS